MLSAAIGGVCLGITCQRPSRTPTGDFGINKKTFPYFREPNGYGNHESKVPVMTPAWQRQFDDLSYACCGGGRFRSRIAVAAGEPGRHGHPGAMLVRRLLPSAHGEPFGAPALEGQSCLPRSAIMSDCRSSNDSSAGCRELRSGPTRWRRRGLSGHHACPAPSGPALATLYDS